MLGAVANGTLVACSMSFVTKAATPKALLPGLLHADNDDKSRGNSLSPLVPSRYLEEQH